MLRKIYDYIGKIELVLSQVLLVVMIILVLLAGLSRELKNPIFWASPMASFFFAWVVFFSMDLAFRRNKLMTIDFVVKKFPERVRRYINIFNYICISAFFIYLIIFGIKGAIDWYLRSYEGMYGFSYTWVTISVPMGSFFILITTIVKIIDEIKALKRR